VGNSSTQVTITNNDPADGYSENLIASVVSTTGGITGSGSTGDIAAQATNNAITLDVSAASAGVAGTVTLDFTTDGTGVDGLGAVDLGQQTFSVSALAQLIYVSSGVVSGGLGIVSGGILEVLSGGTASGATISSGGTEIISAGGSDLGTQISGGLQLDYGSAGGATVFTGSQVVESGGLATSTTVNSGGTELVLARGVATSTVIYKGATETISAGGTDSLAQISGTQNLYGTATSDVIFDPMAQPGVQNVEAGGTAFATTISSGGEQIVFSAGSASGTIVSSGGTEIVSGGSTDLGAKISGGVQLDYGYASGATVFTGSQVVETGGTASGTGVIGGGFELVSSGGTGAATTISGGKEELAAGAVASGAITFAGTGGILKIDGTVMPTNVVSGFVEGDTFDLAGVAFSSGGTAQVVSGHVLQVVENATTYNLQLDSSVSYATDAFRLTSDGSGGTDVIIHGPALSNIATSGSYVEEGGAITLATSGTVSDQDSSTLIGATVAITSGTFANDADVLAANTSGTSITASYNSGTETLTLSGTDTLAHYQQVLRSVSFVAGENPTNYGADPTRTVTWTVNDGGASFNLSPPQTTTIGITNVNDPPVLSNVASTVTFHSGTTTTLSPNTSVSDPDDLSLVGGTVIVTSGGFANDGDVLSATTSGTNITATYNSGSETLTLSGTDTLAHYQSVLDSVTLASGNNPTNTGANRTRTVTWQVNDGEAANNLSTPVQTTVKITTIDSSRPVVTPTSLAVNQSHLHTVAASTLFTAGDADGDFIVQYDFWDTGVGGAHWIINGTPSIPNTDNYASNLSQVGYQSGDGTDTLYVRASDGTGFGPWSQAFTVTDTAPVVTPTSANVNVGHGTVAATSLFTAADADADGIVQYDLWDSGQAGGDWLLNGNALPNGQDNFVPGSQLSQVTYRGGAGTETIYERASDGIQYGAWVSINATGADTAPVVEPTSASIVVSHNSSVAASTLFTVYDQDGDTITQYDFWDDGAGGGHWHLPSGNSVPNADNFVSAAQLSQVAYTPGAGSDTLWVRANDGVQWSAWSNPFTATDAAPASTPAQLMVSAFAGKTFAASNLFTAADADGDGIFQYDFWNSGTNGGQWMLGTSVLPAGQDNPVPKAQLSKVTYKAGTGPDTIWERATDGIHFGAWSPAVSVVFAPVANSTQSASNISHDQTVAATTLFTATDADGDPIVQYDFWDTGMGGAHWVINGHAGNINADNIVTDPTQVSYQSGTGTDTLWMRVADASAFGPWSQPFTATDTAPVTTPVSNTIFAATGQTFAASSLFTANDADTDPPVQYDFWDSGAGGGHWFNGAQQLGNGQSNPVSIAQLSQITYHAGSGTDTLWVRTNDGLQWSAWSNPFTATGGTTQSSPSSVNIPGGGSTEIGPTSAASANFASNTGTLKLDNSQSFTGTVAGLVGQDALDLADINFINGTTTANLMNATSAGGTLHVTDGTHQANIALLGNYLASTFTTSSDGHGGTAVIDPAVLGGVAPLVTPPHT
jgi:autotransporter passenger strand-loop-strand repeat protein